jgi:hypothetical protein
VNELPGLEPGEQLLARAVVAFRGSAAATAQSMLSLRTERIRRQAFEAWRLVADQSGFPTAGPEMVVGATDRRLVVWRASFWWSRPKALAGSVPLEHVLDAATRRHGLVTSLALVMRHGEVVEVESMHGRRLRALAAAVHRGRAHPPGPIA